MSIKIVSYISFVIVLVIGWRIVSLIDLYSGFTLFSLWIWYRRQSFVEAILWIISIMLLGFLPQPFMCLWNRLVQKGIGKRFGTVRKSPKHSVLPKKKPGIAAWLFCEQFLCICTGINVSSPLAVEALLSWSGGLRQSTELTYWR